jgi:hypothetical protein
MATQAPPRRSLARLPLPRLALLALLVPFACAPLASCKSDGPGESIVISGTVQGMGQGCWALQTRDGNYELMNLPDRYRKPGTLATIHGKPRPDMASICMLGPIVEVQKVEDGVR